MLYDEGMMSDQPQNESQTHKFLRVRARTHELLEWLVKFDRRGSWIEEVAVIAEDAVRSRGYDPATLEPIEPVDRPLGATPLPASEAGAATTD